MVPTSNISLRLLLPPQEKCFWYLNLCLIVGSMHGPGVDSSHDCHNCERETPLTLYVALKIHAVTQKRMLVDAPFNLGMCVSYSHFLQLTSDLGNGICDQFALGRVVYPPKMRSGLYIDCNPSAATAKNSFHSTGISLMQHPFHEFDVITKVYWSLTNCFW